MKYVVVLGDGMADWKIESLGNKTCLEAANTVTLNKLAPLSEVGLCKTVPDGMKPGSDVANMSVLGFDPHRFYTGRSPLEAVSMGIKLTDTDVTLRCNLVTLSDEENYEDKTLVDYSAGEISTEEAAELIAYLKSSLDDERFTLYSGISYRHCLVVKNGVTGHDLTPPHDISDRKITDHLPKGALGAVYLEM
ncbi:MAG: phosphoglycerate mutase, partial [Clostridia bacterium]|nr:phosphoglycerate mutase [Clostridia bacterium]